MLSSRNLPDNSVNYRDAQERGERFRSFVGNAIPLDPRSCSIGGMNRKAREYDLLQLFLWPPAAWLLRRRQNTDFFTIPTTKNVMRWFDVPIPESPTDKSALDYHQIPIDLTGAANQEQLVPVSQCAIASRSAYAHSTPPYHHTFKNASKIPLLRESVVQKLAEVNTTLKDYGVQLLVLDGFRPVELQQELWDYFIEVARKRMHSASEHELVTYVGMYWSDPREYNPDDYRTWPTHNTGGAIDLTLQDLDSGQDLFMGSVFDDSDAISSTRFFENEKLASLTAIEARRNRRLLYHAMHSRGFFNYHHEWWHYDLGTQMSIMNGSTEKIARYGRALDASTRIHASAGDIHKVEESPFGASR